MVQINRNRPISMSLAFSLDSLRLDSATNWPWKDSMSFNEIFTESNVTCSIGDL